MNNNRMQLRKTKGNSNKFNKKETSLECFSVSKLFMIFLAQ